MSSDSDIMSKSIDKVVGEVQRASCDVNIGAAPSEAFYNHVKSSPEDLIYEFCEIAKRSNNPTYLAMKAGTSLQQWQLSAAGNVIIPNINEQFSAVGKIIIPDNSEEIKRKRENAKTMASAGKHITSIIDMYKKDVKHILEISHIPAALSPHMVRALDKPTPSVIAFLPSLVTVAVMYWMKSKKNETN